METIAEMLDDGDYFGPSAEQLRSILRQLDAATAAMQAAGAGYPSGRSATKVVTHPAASDLRKAQADYAGGGPDINAAIAALPAGGGKVVLSEGTFNIAAVITLLSNTSLQGQGRATILKRPDSTDANLLYATSLTNVILSDFLINGNLAGNSTNRSPIVLDTCDNCVVRDIRVSNALAGAASGTHRAAVRLLSSTRIMLSDLRVDSPTGMAISLNACGDCVVKGSIITGPSTWGIDVDAGSYNIVVNDNIVYVAGYDGIFIEEGSHRISVTNNNCNECGRSGITLNQQEAGTLEGITVAGNVCHANTENGMVVTASAASTIVQDVTIAGNVCTENSRGSTSYDGLHMGGHASGLVRGVVVSGNRFGDRQGSKTQKYGMEVEATVTGLAIGNDFGENITAGVLNSSPTFVLKDNPGYNPVGVLGPPAVPATTVAYTNAYGVDAQVFIAGGTVTVIKIGSFTTGLTSGMFVVPAGQTITITYSSVPTWTWYGL